MKLDDVHADRSGVEDRRGGRGRAAGGLPVGKGGGIAGVVVLLLMAFLGRGALTDGGSGGGTGVDIGDILGEMRGDQSSTGSSGAAPAGAESATKDAQYEFVARVRTVLNEFWEGQFAASGQAFEPAGLVIFDAPTPTGGCGVGQPEFGPFYCPGDNKMYLDFDFYARLERQLGFSGDFAMAYVLAHEYGHHIQNLLGINAEVARASRNASPAEANDLSVRTELQADCFAGVWARSAYDDDRLEAGDFDEAIAAAKAVGDDAIARKAGEDTNPEGWTHGSSEQRQQWFRTGFESGDPSRCDTF